MALKVKADLSATGEGSALVITHGWLRLSGTWTGTVNLQTDPNNDGTWTNATDENGTAIALTGNINCPIDNSLPVKTRVYFTRSSGTVTYTLMGEPTQR